MRLVAPRAIPILAPVRSDAERERLRETFDQAAEIYHRVRPDYPEALFEDLIALAGLAPGDRLLEVGCATGKATLPLARRGFRITCVELGAELAAVARRNLAGFDVEVVQGRFEDWRPDEPVSLVFAATAWHWIDPGVRYQRAWEALRPGGHLALWAQEHVFPDGGDPFFEEIQEVYDEIGEGLPPDAVRARPGELEDDRAGIEASGLFEVTGVRQYDWERVYDGRGVHRAAQHVLRAPDHGGLAAGPAVRGDPAAAGAAAGPVGAAGLGDGAARGAAAGAAVTRRRWRSAVVRRAGSG